MSDFNVLYFMWPCTHCDEFFRNDAPRGCLFLLCMFYTHMHTPKTNKYLLYPYWVMFCFVFFFPSVPATLATSETAASAQQQKRYDSDTQEMVIMIGFPGSGKS